MHGSCSLYITERLLTFAKLFVHKMPKLLEIFDIVTPEMDQQLQLLAGGYLSSLSVTQNVL